MSSTLLDILEAEFDHARNNGVELKSAGLNSHKKVWWKCTKYNHSYEMAIRNRKEDNCSYCSGKKILLGFNDLAALNPCLASEWDKNKNTLNISEISPYSHKSAWWKCSKGHSWEAQIKSRHASNRGCPVCSNKLLVIGINDFATTHEYIASEWHPTKNGNLSPQDVFGGSKKKVWWKGSLCGHEWESQILSRTRGHGCPICDGKQVLFGFNDFWSSQLVIVKEWHPTMNLPLTPKTVTKASGKKYWWQCLRNPDHVWSMRMNDRTISGQGCPECAVLKNNFISQPEKDLYEFITGLGFTVYQSDRSVLKNVSARELDLFVPERMFAVEFNGLYWHSELAGKGSEYHRSKFVAARAAGVELLQVWEDDWMNRRAAILHTIASRLGAVQSAASGELTPIELTRTQVGEFLDAYSIQGEVSADVFYGLQDVAGVVQAVLALDVDTHSAEVVRFAARGNTGNGFAELLTHAVKILELHTVTAVVDNAVDNAGMFEAFGFIKAGDIAPASYNVVKASRVTDAGGVNRIWDAGKTKYRFSV